jgi:serine/threonine-protein kinase
MGVVWEVQDSHHDRRAALKLLTSLSDARLRDRMLREAEVLADLHHPNIVRLYEASPEDPPYLLMERVAGVPLSELDREVDLVDVCRQLAAGLEVLHERGLIHRDLKPANILVDDHEDRVVLIDFGLVLDPARTALTDGVGVIGTLPFIAPERLRGGAASASSDWYAWGVSLFLLLEGRLPFPTPEIWATARGEPLPEPTFSTIAPDDPLRDLVTACLAEDPDRRPASGLEIDAVLAQAGAIPRARQVPSTQCQAVLVLDSAPGASTSAPPRGAAVTPMEAVGGPRPGRASPAPEEVPCAGCGVDVALDPTRSCPTCQRPNHVMCWRLAEGCGDPTCRGADGEFRARVFRPLASATPGSVRTSTTGGPLAQVTEESWRSLGLVMVLVGFLSGVASAFLWPSRTARVALAFGVLGCLGGILVYVAADAIRAALRGGGSRQKGWLEQASLVQLQAAHREAPRNVAILARMADVYRAQGDAFAAWQTYEQALRLAPARTDLRIGKARALISCDRLPEARRELDRVREASVFTDAARQAEFWLMSLDLLDRRAL